MHRKWPIKCSETSRNPPEASVFDARTFPEPSETLPALADHAHNNQVVTQLKTNKRGSFSFLAQVTMLTTTKQSLS